MSWYEKHQSMQFDNQPIEGLFYLDGNRVSTAVERHWAKGQKYPVVVFPSGVSLEIWESGNPDIMGIIHLFGEMDLPYNQRRDAALQHVSEISEVIGYGFKAVGADGLAVWGFETDEHFLITYDNDSDQMVDVVSIKEPAQEPAIHPAHKLMTEEIQEKLPPLYANEKKGLDAIAPVKYFHALSNWTWYASEYDPEHGIFYGLVSGYEIEFGLFSLEELQSIGIDERTIPVERDLYYQPQTLKELQAYERKLRG